MVALDATASQIGCIDGTALLNTIAASATAAYFATQTPCVNRGGPGARARVFRWATDWGTAIFILAAVVVAVMVNAAKPAP